jgi:translation initiation factor IF-3
LDALNLAKEAGLDLMMVSETSDPPVCKIVNFGQFKYQQRKKEKQSQKKAKGQIIKELKMSPKISEHDFLVRVNRGREFLEKGFKVKVSVPFRGREIIHPELGQNIAARFIELVKDLGTLEGNVTQAGRSLLAFVNPK